MKKKIASAVKVFLALGLGILIIWLSLKDLTQEETNSIISSFKKANYFWVVLTILLGVLSHFIRSVRWSLLLKPMGYSPSHLNSFYCVMVGYFANLGIPRSGEVIRCSILYKVEKVPVEKSLGTVIIERTIDMLVFFLLSFLIIILEWNKISDYVTQTILPKLSEKTDILFQNPLTIIYIIIAFLAFLIVLYKLRNRFFSSKIGKKIKELLLGLLEGLKSIGKIQFPLLFIFYTLSIWFLYYLMIYLCFFSLPQTENMGISAGLSVLVLGAIGMMVTPGGLGLYPVIVAETLVLYGLSYESKIGIAMGYIAWGSQTLMIILFGLISLTIVFLKKRKDEPLPKTEK